MNKNRVFRLLLTVVLSLTVVAGLFFVQPRDSVAAKKNADQDRWYLMVGGGRTFDVDTASISQVNGTSQYDDDNVVRLGFGFQLFRYLAIEANLIDLDKLEGDFTGTVVTNAGTNTGTFPVTDSIDGITAAVIWHIPIFTTETRRGTFFLKGGVFRWSNEQRFDLGGGITGTRKSKGTDGMAALGMQIRGEGKAGFRFELQRLETETKEILLGSINFIYFF